MGVQRKRPGPEQRILDTCLKGSKIDPDKVLALLRRTEKKAFKKGIQSAISVADNYTVELFEAKEASEKNAVLFNGLKPAIIAPTAKYDAAITLSTKLRSLLK